MRPAREVYEYKCARKRHVKGKKYRDDQRLESPSASPSDTERKKKRQFHQNAPKSCRHGSSHSPACILSAEVRLSGRFFYVSNLTNCVSLTSFCPWSGLAHVRTADLPTPKNPQLSPFHPNPAGHAGRRLWGRKQLMVLMMVNFSFIATKLRGWAQFFSRRGDAVPAECLSDWDRSVLSNKNGSSVCGGSWF